ncbi:transposase [Holospora curviuscula]
MLDYASFHNTSKSKKVIELLGFERVFLPTYSPDLSSIEKFLGYYETMH